MILRLLTQVSILKCNVSMTSFVISGYFVPFVWMVICCLQNKLATMGLSLWSKVQVWPRLKVFHPFLASTSVAYTRIVNFKKRLTWQTFVVICTPDESQPSVTGCFLRPKMRMQPFCFFKVMSSCIAYIQLPFYCRVQSTLFLVILRLPFFFRPNFS